MTKERPTKKQLKKVLKLTKKILEQLPEGDSMYLMYHKMVTRLTDRIETYEQFYINPYTTVTSLPKFNSDTELELGGYTASEDEEKK